MSDCVKEPSNMDEYLRCLHKHDDFPDDVVVNFDLIFLVFKNILGCVSH